MDVSSAVCILLVDANSSNLASLSHLLRSKYLVVTAASGANALSILERHNGITLMMIDNHLPDISSFDFVKYVDHTRKLPIVMMCDTEKSVGDGLLSGAVGCIVKPVRPDNIEVLWHLPILKRRQEMLEPQQPLMLGIPEHEPVAHGITNQVFSKNSSFHQASILQNNGPVMPESSDGSQNNKKRKMDEMQRGCDSFMGQTTPFISTPDRNRKFPRVSHDLGSSSAAPSASACRVNVPCVTKRIQPLHLYIKLEQILSTQMAYATSTNFPNPSFTMGQNMRRTTPNNHEYMHKLKGSSPLTRLMQDPYCWAQLKGIVKGSMLRWAVKHGALSNLNTPVWVANNFALARRPSPEPYPALRAMWNTPPPPLATFLSGSSNAPPMSVPRALVQEIQEFIYSSLNDAHAQLGFTVASPQQVGGGEEYGPGVMRIINADEMYDAIMMLLDD